MVAMDDYATFGFPVLSVVSDTDITNILNYILIDKIQVKLDFDISDLSFQSVCPLLKHYKKFFFFTQLS